MIDTAAGMDIVYDAVREDLRRTDAALWALEETNCDVYNAWLARQERRDSRGDPPRVMAPRSIYPEPTPAIQALIADLRYRYDSPGETADCRTTVSAHEELFRLQEEILEYRAREIASREETIHRERCRRALVEALAPGVELES